MIYVDTNIFIDRGDKSSPNHKSAVLFLDNTINTSEDLATSTETIQELVYFGQKKKKLSLILQICDLIICQLKPLLVVDDVVIGYFLKYARQYPKSGSRDLIHLASCSANHINTIITYDRDFLKFKEIHTLTPQEYLNRG